MAGQLDEAAKQILGTLLADFTDRGLTAQDLKKGYEGPNINALATAVCNVADFTSVDFEVAFGDLEKSKLIRTGPMKCLIMVTIALWSLLALTVYVNSFI